MTDDTQEPRAPKIYDVPAGTHGKPCVGPTCRAVVYWIDGKLNPKTHRRARVPINCDVPGGAKPNDLEPGRGVIHFTDCPDRDQFRRK